MKSSHPRRGFVGVLAMAMALTAMWSPASGAPPGGKDPRPDGAENQISSRLVALESPELRDATPKKQATALSLPSKGAGSLMRGPNNSIQVEVVTTNTDPALVAALVTAGALLVHVSERYSTVTADVAPNRLGSVAAVPGVVAVTEVLKPQLNAAGPRAEGGVHSSATCPPLTSEASTQLQAGLARTNYGVDGTGVKIGVLSDSYASITTPTTAAQDVTTGALPGVDNPCGFTTPVVVLNDLDPGEGTDEGRGMAQLVHGVAPDAELMFATAWGSQSIFADNIHALADAGADVIVDDVSYFQEPFFQDGIVTNAVKDVVRQGASYFSSAGNSNTIVGGNDVGSWETPAYRPTSCPAAVAALGYSDCMNFAPTGPPDNTNRYTLGASKTFLLNTQWAEPWYDASMTDLDVFLLDGTTGAVLAQSRLANAITPWEYFSYTNGASPLDVDVVIGRSSGTDTPRTKTILQRSRAVTAAEYPVSAGGDIVGPTIFGHNGGTDTLGVAAIPYDSSTTPETYSSRGPATLYYGPVDGTTPAAPLAAPYVADSPQFTATDGDCTTFFGQPTGDPLPCPYRFYGTSAAAPNAAAVAALALDAVPMLTPAKVGELMASTATALSGGSPTSTGAGLLDANGLVGAALALLPGPPTGVTATSGAGRVTVSWVAPASITGYQVTASPGGRGCGTFGGTSCTVTGLTNGRAYTFKVTATNEWGTGSASAASAPVTPLTAPSRVRDCTVYVKGHKWRFNWKGPRNTGGEAVRYVARISKPNSQKYGPWQGPWDKLGAHARIENLTAVYRIQARAFNSAGDGPSCTMAFRSVTPGPALG